MTLADRIRESSKGWYKLKLSNSEEYYQIFSFNSQNGGNSITDYYFTASIFDKQGNMLNPRQSVPLANLQKLEYITEEGLPWIKGKISKEERETRNRFYAKSDKLFPEENKPNLNFRQTGVQINLQKTEIQKESDFLHLINTNYHFPNPKELAVLALSINETAKKNKLNLSSGRRDDLINDANFMMDGHY